MAREFTDQELAKRKKLAELIEKNKNPFEYKKFARNYNSVSFVKEFENHSKEELHENKTQILIAGRVMAIRQTFGVIKDFYGKVQFYINKKTINPQTWELFNNFIDLGDFIGIEGTPMKTNTGEVTIRVDKIELLSKSLKPLPEKFHGLTSDEARARQRYVDLLINEDSMKTFVTRSKISSVWRKFLDEKDFFEVETPVLQPIYGGAAAKPFTTHYNALDKEFFLRIAPEIPLKKLIVGGFEKVYEFSRNFRNEGVDTTHNPEFTGFELYWAYVDLHEIMDLTEEIFKTTCAALNKYQFKFRGFDIDLSQPFKKISMVELIKQETGVDFNNINTDEEAVAIANEKNVKLSGHQMSKGHIINLFFERFCEEKCIQPTLVHTYPVEVSPLTKKNKDNPQFADRFELFIGQKEFANAYSELNDPIDQLERLENQMQEKTKGNTEAYANEIDMDFINAMEYGMPPTGGLGIGFDRFCMLFTESDSIRDVLLFPQMKDANN